MCGRRAERPGATEEWRNEDQLSEREEAEQTRKKQPLAAEVPFQQPRRDSAQEMQRAEKRETEAARRKGSNLGLGE